MLRGIGILILCTQSLFGLAGNITSLTGPTQITREKERIKGDVQVPVEMYDIIETLQSRTGITFVDDTKVNITEHSKLKIDEFVYDPNTGKGKLTMKATLGTVRYASGRIAKNSRENVNVMTPTASIAVRGTDFSMSVDEVGRSLVVLLPSKDNKVGMIEVSNLAGTVVLDKAFEGTFVASAQTAPTPPVIFDIDESKIGNDLLLDEPKPVDPPQSTVQEEESEENSKGILDTDLVDEQVIERIDASKFVFIEGTTISTLKNKISEQTVFINIPRGVGATVNYFYPGGAAVAKNGTGTGINMNITQR